MKRRYHLLGVAFGLTVTVLFVLYVVRSLSGHDLGAYATPRALLGIVAAALFWSTGIPLMALAWKGMLAGLGVHRTWRELTGIVGITQFAKYVPGNVAQHLGRVGMSMARGIPARAVAVTILLETLLVMVAAVAVAVGTGVLSKIGLELVRHHSSQLGLVVGLVALAVLGLFVFRSVALRLLRRFAPEYAPTLKGNLLPPQGILIRTFVLYCSVYLTVGVGLVLLAHFLLPGVNNDDWLLIASFALAWIVGFITPGAPAGFGVREGLQLLMLTPVYGAASASILVIALRIATTLGDVFGLIGGLFILPKSQRHLSQPST